MAAQGYTLFDTPIGRCAIAWSARGIVGLQLPEAGEAQTGARLKKRFPGALEMPPPPETQSAIDAVRGLLDGDKTDLSAIPLDMDDIPPFHRAVYEVARAIPPGKTLTYGEIAASLGDPGAARAVGQALGQNPIAIIVPCHRVLAAGGKTGGFSANGGIDTKLKMLSIERARTSDAPLLFEDLPLAAKSSRR
jgi:methylated-DNA-[protein]-cysteine S-methyltransferase